MGVKSEANSKSSEKWNKFIQTLTTQASLPLTSTIRLVFVTPDNQRCSIKNFEELKSIAENYGMIENGYYMLEIKLEVLGYSHEEYLRRYKAESSAFKDNNINNINDNNDDKMLFELSSLQTTKAIIRRAIHKKQKIKQDNKKEVTDLANELPSIIHNKDNPNNNKKVNFPNIDEDIKNGEPIVESLNNKETSNKIVGNTSNSSNDGNKQNSDIFFEDLLDMKSMKSANCSNNDDSNTDNNITNNNDIKTDGKSKPNENDSNNRNLNDNNNKKIKDKEKAEEEEEEKVQEIQINTTNKKNENEEEKLNDNKKPFSLIDILNETSHHNTQKGNEENQQPKQQPFVKPLNQNIDNNNYKLIYAQPDQSMSMEEERYQYYLSHHRWPKFTSETISIFNSNTNNGINKNSNDNNTNKSDNNNDTDNINKSNDNIDNNDNNANNCTNNDNSINNNNTNDAKLLKLSDVLNSASNNNNLFINDPSNQQQPQVQPQPHPPIQQGSQPPAQVHEQFLSQQKQEPLTSTLSMKQNENVDANDDNNNNNRINNISNIEENTSMLQTVDNIGELVNHAVPNINPSSSCAPIKEDDTSSGSESASSESSSSSSSSSLQNNKDHNNVHNDDNNENDKKKNIKIKLANMKN